MVSCMCMYVVGCGALDIRLKSFGLAHVVDVKYFDTRLAGTLGKKIIE